MAITKITLAPIAVLSCFFTVAAFANDERKNNDIIECSDAAQVSMDASFGPAADFTPASALTECIQKTRKLKIVVAWNEDALNGKKKYGQQVVNVENMVSLYSETFELKPSDFEIVIMAYQAGAKWLLTNDGYDAHHGTADPSDPKVSNPSLGAVQGLLAQGVKIFACQNTMKGNGYLTNELIPGVQMVPGGVTGFLDYEFRGYKGITP